MGKGFDTSTSLTASLAAAFAAQDYSFVGRYLAPEGHSKRLLPEEADTISAAGLSIVSFFERYAERAREGAAAGAEDGCLALQLAREVGQPEGSTIYFAVDYDGSPGDYDAIDAYMRAADKAIPGYELGVYGSFFVVEEMRGRGVATKLMQTLAWSSGRWSEYTSIEQFDNGPTGCGLTMNGILVDHCRSNGDMGGWIKGMAIKQLPVLDIGVANTIINTWISPSWKETTDPKQRDYLHWLANELRRASGQPEEEA